MPEDFQSYDDLIAAFGDSPSTVTISEKDSRDLIKSLFHKRNVEITVSRGLASSDAHCLLYYTGAAAININLPGTLIAGFNVTIWNRGTANITFVPTGGGVTAEGELVLAPGQMAKLEQSNGNKWKITNNDALKAADVALDARLDVLEPIVGGLDGGADISNAMLLEWFDECYQKLRNSLPIGTPLTYRSDFPEIVATANVVWPDSSAGVYTLTAIDNYWEAETAWTITHALSGKTVTQSTITINATTGAETKPTPTIS